MRDETRGEEGRRGRAHLDDVFMSEFSQELDLSDGIDGEPVLELSDFDLLDGDFAICCDFSTWTRRKKEGREEKVSSSLKEAGSRSRHHLKLQQLSCSLSS